VLQYEFKEEAAQNRNGKKITCKRNEKKREKKISRPRPYNSKMPKMTHKVNIKQDYTRRNWELEMVI